MENYRAYKIMRKIATKLYSAEFSFRAKNKKAQSNIHFLNVLVEPENKQKAMMILHNVFIKNRSSEGDMSVDKLGDQSNGFSVMCTMPDMDNWQFKELVENTLNNAKIKNKVVEDKGGNPLVDLKKEKKVI